MNPYLLAVLALLLAAIAQTSAAWIAAESFWRKGQGSSSRRSWLALTLAAGLLALHSGYTLELALRTGLYDLRQADPGGPDRPALCARHLRSQAAGLKAPASVTIQSSR